MTLYLGVILYEATNIFDRISLFPFGVIFCEAIRPVDKAQFFIANLFYC